MPFALALAFSALLHAAAIVMPGWNLPGAGEPEAPPLEAHLAPLPRPQPAPVEKARPRPPPPKRLPAAAAPAAPAVVAAAPAMPETPAAVPAPAPVVATPLAEPPAPVVAVPPAPPAPPWPSQGRLRYAATYGEGGMTIGETVQEWRVADGHYSIRSSFTPKGLAVMFGKTRTQVSSGEVTADGLRPAEFRDRREGRAEETASFDWAAARAAFSSGRSAGPLTPGTQDLLSVFFQLAWSAPGADAELAVATASRLGRWTFEWAGEETLELAVGTISTWHWRTRADGDTTEVWLAPAYGGLPVRIRYIDRKGDVFEQTADLMEPNR